MAQSSGGAIKSMVYVPLSTRVFIGTKALITYLWKTILPVNLIPFYPYPKNVSLASLEYVSAMVLVSGITIFCTLWQKEKLWLSVGYYLITLFRAWYCSGGRAVNGGQIYVFAVLAPSL
jgi:hypothetical protein